jgi:hypothetical protein
MLCLLEILQRYRENSVSICFRWDTLSSKAGFVVPDDEDLIFTLMSERKPSRVMSKYSWYRVQSVDDELELSACSRENFHTPHSIRVIRAPLPSKHFGEQWEAVLDGIVSCDAPQGHAITYIF